MSFSDRPDVVYVGTHGPTSIFLKASLPGLPPRRASMKKATEPHPDRHNVSLSHIATQIILTEQKRRKRAGSRHTSFSDIIEDCVLGFAKQHNWKLTDDGK